MFKSINVAVVSMTLISVGQTASAVVLDDFEDASPVWNERNGSGGSLTIANTTTKPFFGDQSMQITDSNTTQPYVKTSAGFGDLSALSTTYVEFAISNPNLGDTTAGTNALAFQIGTGESNRTNWTIQESAFINVDADANGWWVLHLELDGSGQSIATGATLNGADISTNTLVNTTGTVDWSDINWLSVLPQQSSGSLVWTTYVDQITLGSPVPEPATAGLLAVGGLLILGRNRR